MDRFLVKTERRRDTAPHKSNALDMNVVDNALLVVQSRKWTSGLLRLELPLPGRCRPILLS
jgi:hypothetical protein